jgi:hypothetical protein
MRVEQDEETQAHWIEIIKKIGDENEWSEGKKHWFHEVHVSNNSDYI